MYKLSIIDKISYILVIIGAVNWGLIGLFNFNFVSFLFGNSLNAIIRIVYIIIGVASLDLILLFIKNRNSYKNSSEK